MDQGHVSGEGQNEDWTQSVGFLDLTTKVWCLMGGARWSPAALPFPNTCYGSPLAIY